MPHLKVICKPQTLNDGGEDLVKYSLQKALLSSSHFAFYRYDYYNLIASLSHLEALCLNVTLNALNNCLF